MRDSMVLGFAVTSYGAAGELGGRRKFCRPNPRRSAIARPTQEGAVATPRIATDGAPEGPGLRNGAHQPRQPAHIGDRSAKQERIEHVEHAAHTWQHSPRVFLSHVAFDE